MKAEEFDNNLDIMLHNDELSPTEIIISVRQMREAYAEYRTKDKDRVIADLNWQLSLLEVKVYNYGNRIKELEEELERTKKELAEWKNMSADDMGEGIGLAGI